MKLAFNLLVGLLFCFESATAQDDLREWIDDTGKYKTRAALVKVHEDKIELRLENGETLMVPKVRLSKADVAYLRDLALQQKKPPAPPAAKDLPEKIITNSIGMKLVLIPKGTFMMGSPPSEENSTDDERQHEVTISQDYYLGVYEVTQAQYEKVMGKNPSYFQGDEVAERHPLTFRVVKEVDTSKHPVEAVGWEDAVEFCQRLSELPEEKKAGRVYRLPTEAEWEYACRAGRKTAFSFGDDPTSLGDYAWFGSNSGSTIGIGIGSKTHPVGEKKPNAWGLYDMHGNVLEWCSDGFRKYPQTAVTDPVGPKGEGGSRVARGGCWSDSVPLCRAASRRTFAPMLRGQDIGFRLCLSSPGIPKQLEPEEQPNGR